MELRKHYYSADLIRIFSIFMIITVHSTNVLLNIPDFIHKIFSAGAYGVAGYFVICGFLSPQSVDKQESFRKYIIKKTKRIYPMYFISLLCTFIVGGVLYEVYPVTWQWLYSVFFLNMYIPSKEWMWWNSVNFFWTMPAFISWYLISFFILKRIRSSAESMKLTLAIMLCSQIVKRILTSISNSHFANWNFFSLFYVFMIGVVAYYIIKEQTYFKGIIYGLILGIFGYIIGNKSGFLLFGILFYILLMLLNKIRVNWGEYKISKVINVISSASYSTYLSHWFVLTVFGSYFKKMPWYISYLLVATSALFFGIFCWKFIEMPISKFLKSVDCRAVMKYNNRTKK